MGVGSEGTERRRTVLAVSASLLAVAMFVLFLRGDFPGETDPPPPTVVSASDGAPTDGMEIADEPFESHTYQVDAHPDAESSDQVTFELRISDATHSRTGDTMTCIDASSPEGAAGSCTAGFDQAPVVAAARLGHGGLPYKLFFGHLLVDNAETIRLRLSDGSEVTAAVTEGLFLAGRADVDDIGDGLLVLAYDTYDAAGDLIESLEYPP